MKNLEKFILRNAGGKNLIEIMLIIFFFFIASLSKSTAQSSFDSSKSHQEEVQILFTDVKIQNLYDNLSINPNAIHPKKSKIPESVKVISVYAGSIILDAVGDGLNDSGKKEWGHFCNAASVELLLVSPFVIDYKKDKWGGILQAT